MLSKNNIFCFVLLLSFALTEATVDIFEVFLDGNSSTNEGPVGGTVIAEQANPVSNNKFYMSFAGAAYCLQDAPKYQNEPLVCNWCGPLSAYKYYTTITNSTYNTLALVVVNPGDNLVVVAFRGTLNLPNVMEDFSFGLVSVDGGSSPIKVHAGYRAATLSLYTDVLNILKNLTDNYGYNKVIITGHSLGGAEASLTTYSLVSDSELSTSTTLELYTYGQPRGGNKAWADYMNNLDIVVSRIVNKGDLVPHSVPAWFGYYHHQNEFWIKNSTAEYYCDDTVYEDPSCSNSLGPNYSAFDHVVYYDINVLECAALNPIPYAFQLIIDLTPLVSFLRLLALQAWAATLSLLSP